MSLSLTMSEMLEKIHEQSSWIRNASLIQEDYHLEQLRKIRYVWHHEEFLNHPFSEGVYLITGPRQVGKSTHCKLLIERLLKQSGHRNILYFNCDLLDSKQEIVDLVTVFQDQIADREKPLYIILDEITSIKDSLLGIKYLVDSGRGRRTTFILTGSSTINLEKTGEYLPGRRGKGRDFIFHPLSFRETVLLRYPEAGEIIRKMTFKQKKLPSLWQELRAQIPMKKVLDDYLISGGFPKVINAWLEKKTIDQEIFSTYRDWIVSEIAKQRRQEHLCKQMFERIQQSLTSTVSYQSFVQDTNLGSHNTVQDYLSFFEGSFIIQQCYHYDLHRRRINFRKNKKIYWNDPFIFWMMNAWLNAKGKEDFAQLADQILKSRLIENVIANELYRQRSELWYYQNGNEIDFITTAQAIEVKYQSRVVQADFQQLLKIPASYQKIVVSKDKTEFGKEVTLLPVELFLLMS